ncbi:polysaccharide pyruvyl transferase WcaK-like protein [Aliiruegeria haliotis]|uniref:Polysaccharide pyruvyl transferase WcaK-like protein n=1 Tax=Aliiruegeria haliotis TaxID=1280846 RepID=A0A2T0RVD1_9RHOB|nr:polysaccharide pyruvyl transferase family protein [Aliiruegeria haliotis]PRY25156.1 polysaccharide pyruvyl transferase WcaK-like protein [Aliiruegeria haliotis]
MKIVQFGLPYSPNVGDGIISDCLLFELSRQAPGAEVLALDLSGRESFGDVVVRNRGLALRILASLPQSLRQRLVAARLGRLLDRVTPRWTDALSGADLAIIGGGQLMSDADLNFPLKVAAAADCARMAGCPVAVHAVGASDNWSPRGKDLFCNVYEGDLRQVGLRDARSRAVWQAHMGARAPQTVLTRDPGLLAADCYGPTTTRSGRIGLCVTDPTLLRYHAEGHAASGAPGFFRDLALALLAEGHDLRLFCNGAVEDRAALVRLAGEPALAPARRDGRIEVAPVPETPTMLAETIRDLGGVVAHRLHACIVAYSYGLPIVGLGWDAKVASFLEACHCAEHFMPPATRPEQIATTVTAALDTGIDRQVHVALIAETRAAITGLLALLPAKSGNGTA